MFRALLPFALGYFMSYLFRAVNQVIAPDLIADFDLSHGELGRLTAAYLLGFVLFQLPLGILLDRFGPRRVQTALLCVSAGGRGLVRAGAGSLVPHHRARHPRPRPVRLPDVGLQGQRDLAADVARRARQLHHHRDRRPRRRHRDARPPIGWRS